MEDERRYCQRSFIGGREGRKEVFGRKAVGIMRFVESLVILWTN